MIFRAIVLIWVLQYLDAPFWLWVICCIGSLCDFGNGYEISKLKKEFDSLRDHTDKLITHTLMCLDKLREMSRQFSQEE